MRSKRLLALFCTLVMLVTILVSMDGLAETKVDKSLYTRIDPTTGKVYDLKGKTVYIYDWWSNDWHDDQPETEAEIVRYNYRKWLEKTYNCKIVTKVRGDWGTIGDELGDFVSNRENKLAVFILPSQDILKTVAGNRAANWKKSVSISLSDEKWNQNTIEMMTMAGGVYGVSTGKSEPRQLLFFNKRVLNEAGIDWNKIYDLQKSGKWTWDEFTKMLKKIHRDDIYGLTGSGDDWYRIAVFSNNGSFFDYDQNGQLASSVSNPNSMEALTWAKKTWLQYSAPQPDDSSWDWYKQFWLQGSTGFYIGQLWQTMEMSGMADECGYVAFPKGPKMDHYVTVVANNIAVVPNIYSNQDIAKITMIYDLWTCNPPDWDEEEEIPYIGTTDDNAIYETYLLLSGPEGGVWDQTELLGTVNDILGSQLLWYITNEELDELIESAQESWDAYLAAFNEIIIQLQQENAETSVESKGLLYELSIKEKTATVTGAGKNNIKSVTIPDTLKVKNKVYKVTAIGDKAFKDFKKLKTVKIGKNVQSIGKDAFRNCTALTSVSGATGLVVIGDGVFSGCSKLASITLNKKVASIGDEAFLKCKGLKKIVIKTTKLYDEIVGKDTFTGIYKKAVFECPSTKLAEKYKTIFIRAGAPKTCLFRGPKELTLNKK